jgi:type IV secretory pathway TrbF-like protein
VKAAAAVPRPGREPNPYLAARREFESVFGNLAKGKRNWQLMSFALLVLLAAVLAAYIRQGAEARVTPYVVEVDRLGQALAFGPAERLRPSDGRLVVFQLGLLIRNLRAVCSDPEAQRARLLDAYGYLAGSARATLDAWFAEPAHDPRLLGRSLTRQVEVTAVLQVPRSQTWRVSWREMERPRFAGATRATAWEAYLRVEHQPPDSAAAILVNPLGLFVTEINWTQLSLGDSR